MPRAAQQLTNVEHIRRRSEIRQRFDHAWHFSHSAASTCKLSSDISHAGWSDRQRQKTKIKTQSKGNKMRAGGECFGEGLTGFYSAAVSPSSHPSHSFFQVLTPPESLHISHLIVTLLPPSVMTHTHTVLKAFMRTQKLSRCTFSMISLYFWHLTHHLFTSFPLLQFSFPSPVFHPLHLQSSSSSVSPVPWWTIEMPQRMTGCDWKSCLAECVSSSSSSVFSAPPPLSGVSSCMVANSGLSLIPHNALWWLCQRSAWSRRNYL